MDRQMIPKLVANVATTYQATPQPGPVSGNSGNATPHRPTLPSRPITPGARPTSRTRNTTTTAVCTDWNSDMVPPWPPIARSTGWIVRSHRADHR
jgi:hypothetical protein